MPREDQQVSGAPAPLQNCLIDMVVAVGINEVIGLQPSPRQPSFKPQHLASPNDRGRPPNPPKDYRLFSTAFEPAVVAGVSAQTAIFPQNLQKHDLHYPPNMGKSKVRFSMRGRLKSAKTPPQKTSTPSLLRRFGNMGKEEQFQQQDEAFQNRATQVIDETIFSTDEEQSAPSPSVGTSKVSYESRDRSHSFRKVGRSKSLRPADFVRASVSSSSLQMKQAELPMGLDVLESLVSFCFPEGTYVTASPPEDTICCLVLTDLQGSRSYATGVVYYLPYVAEQGETEDSWVIFGTNTQPEETSLSDEQYVCYVPMCVVFISKSPYYMVMKDLLSCLVARLKVERDEWQHLLKEAALHLTSVPVPPAGKVAVRFQFQDSVLPSVTLTPPSFPGQQVIDIQSNLLFQLLKIDEILKLIGCLLTQQRIVFLSSSYVVLTTVIQTLLHLLHPFRWEHVYVSVLPWSLLELLEAPGTYIMGCHVRHKESITRLDDPVILVDLEAGEINRIGRIVIPALPQSSVDILKESLSGLQPNMDLWRMGRKSTFSFDESKELERRFYNSFNNTVFTAFLQLMVNLFRDLLRFVKPERNFFNKDSFLESVIDKDRAFYEEVLETDLFKEFIKDRLQMKMDAWSVLEEKTRPKNSVTKAFSLDVRRSRSLDHLRLFPTATTGDVDLDSLLTGSSHDLTYLDLPNFVYGLNHIYYEKCCDAVTDALKQSPTPTHTSSLYFILGLLKAANGSRLEALECLQKLEPMNTTIFPFSEVADIFTRMSESEQTRLAEKDFYRRSDIWNQISTRKKEQPVVMAFDKLPKDNMDLASFSEMVQLLEIAVHQEAINRLFKALTLEFTTVVDPQTFEEFYRCWKDGEMALREVRLPASSLDPTEGILKVSELVKCSFGMGRVGLTKKRLFFLREGSKRYRDIILLVDITNVIKVEQKNVFTPTSQDLKIISKEEKVKAFQVSLKEERDLWYVMLREMWLGTESAAAAAAGDPAVVQRAADNVMLADAYASTVDSGVVANYLDLQRGLQLLCTHSSSHAVPLPQRGGTINANNSGGASSMERHVSITTPTGLEPSPWDAEKMTVECLLYTSGFRTTGSPGVDVGPKLWCGLGSHRQGKVLVFDAATWSPEKCSIRADNRVVCMTSVGKSHIWAGSFDTKIYVIDVLTRSVATTLLQHSHMVTGITKMEFESTVYSCALNGEILQWDVTTYNCLKTFSVPQTNTLKLIDFGHRLLWCGTCEEINVFSPDGQQRGRLKCSAADIGVEMKFENECFLITSNFQIWVGNRVNGTIVVFNAEDFSVIETLGVTCKGISKMVKVKDKIWAGTKEGRIFIFDGDTRKLLKWMTAHTDAVRAMCVASDRYVLTGSGSQEAKVMIWKCDTMEGFKL